MAFDPSNYNHVIILLLATFFIAIGLLKISLKKSALFRFMHWSRQFKPATIKFIGFYELFAAFCLAGPFLLGIGHYLIPWAAIGLSVLMVLAGIYHSRRNEYGSLLLNFIILLLSLRIAFTI